MDKLKKECIMKKNTISMKLLKNVPLVKKNVKWVKKRFFVIIEAVQSDRVT